MLHLVLITLMCLQFDMNCGNLRCCCINTNYSKSAAREKALQVLAWSFQALSSLAMIQKNNMFVGVCAKQHVGIQVLAIQTLSKVEVNILQKIPGGLTFLLTLPSSLFIGWAENWIPWNPWRNSMWPGLLEVAFWPPGWTIKTVMLPLLLCNSMGEQQNSYWSKQQPWIVVHCLWAPWGWHRDTHLEFEVFCFCNIFLGRTVWSVFTIIWHIRFSRGSLHLKNSAMSMATHRSATSMAGRPKDTWRIFQKNIFLISPAKKWFKGNDCPNDHPVHMFIVDKSLR